MQPTILLIEDEAAFRFAFKSYFTREGYRIVEADNLATASNLLAGQRFDALILDINLPDGNGINFIDTILATDPCLPIIVITGSGDIPLAVEAMRRGAHNFLTKPVDSTELAVFLAKTLEIGAMKRQQAARQRLAPKENIFWGGAPVMKQVIQLARAAAERDCPLLITGETGTGKGCLARWVHLQSSRSRNEFVEVNCSALRGDLLAREMFGAIKGAYTSADQDRKGLLDIADRSTLFLDEIGEMDLSLQAPFLKVLEEKRYRRIGDIKQLSSDFRLICATNRDIDHLAATGLFRQDLLYRINLLEIRIPPLRDRLEDLPQLLTFLLESLGQSHRKLSVELLALLRAYPWPGNVRELKNVLERALILAGNDDLLSEHFACLQQRTIKSAQTAASHSPGTDNGSGSLHDLEIQRIKSVLEQEQGDINKAAKRLGISRATLYRRLSLLRNQAP